MADQTMTVELGEEALERLDTLFEAALEDVISRATLLDEGLLVY